MGKKERSENSQAVLLGTDCSGSTGLARGSSRPARARRSTAREQGHQLSSQNRCTLDIQPAWAPLLATKAKGKHNGAEMSYSTLLGGTT